MRETHEPASPADELSLPEITQSLSMDGYVLSDVEHLPWRVDQPLQIHDPQSEQMPSGYLETLPEMGKPLRLRYAAGDGEAKTIIPCVDGVYVHPKHAAVFLYDSGSGFYTCEPIGADEVNTKTLDDYPFPGQESAHAAEALPPFEMNTMDFFHSNETIFLRSMELAAREAFAFIQDSTGKRFPEPLIDHLTPALKWATRPRENTLKNDPMPLAIIHQYRPGALTQEEDHAIEFVSFALNPKRAEDVQQALLVQGKKTNTLVAKLMSWWK